MSLDLITKENTSTVLTMMTTFDTQIRVALEESNPDFPSVGSYLCHESGTAQRCHSIQITQSYPTLPLDSCRKTPEPQMYVTILIIVYGISKEP